MNKPGPSYISNSVLEKLPNHLRSFILKQPYESYTAQNQSVWRYVMRRNIDFLQEVAHESYISGLAMAGISTDRIPRMSGMNRILKELGWAAVSVDGFIPPNAFMEFQAYNTLVIAADIRTIDHIDYTPAPDIIHEAAGHAPIIANPEYAEYLRRFGEIGSKAISSAQDYDLYQAIRHLSIIKEDPATSSQEIEEAEEQISYISAHMGPPSEMSRIRNMHWWTVEYGLIGSLETPKIYGAGLLSSIRESKWCLTDKVKKKPYTIEAAFQSFDITNLQPQLYVTPDFAHLSMVLEEFADQMALRNGGINAIESLIDSRALGTIELNSGIQISGRFTEVIAHADLPAYFRTDGETALAYKNKELIGHSKQVHSLGFGSPVGKLKGIQKAIEQMSPADLADQGIYEGQRTSLEFESGIIVQGEVITGKRNLQGVIIMISFRDCTVKLGDKLLFHPSWGVYDMVVGSSVVSAFSGLADPNSFGLQYQVPKEKTHRIIYSDSEHRLFSLYDRVKTVRSRDRANIDELDNIFTELLVRAPKDWLLCLEIYELIYRLDNEPLRFKVENHLVKLKNDPSINPLINEGIKLLEKQAG